MSTRTNLPQTVKLFAMCGVACLAVLGACGNGASPVSGSVSEDKDAGIAAIDAATSAIDADGGVVDSDGGMPGAVPIVAGGSPDVPYELGANPYGITGAAFFATANNGSATVMFDTTQTGKVCLKGTVETVPTPADGGHPPYSDWWGFAVGFNLNQGADASIKNPWMVPANVTGFWFTVEGAAIPEIRFKTTPTGKDPAQEQDSCAVVSASTGAPNVVPFTEMYVQCWDGPQGTAATDVSVGLLDVSLQVAADTDGSHDVDFCWTGFGVITN